MSDEVLQDAHRPAQLGTSRRQLLLRVVALAVLLLVGLQCLAFGRRPAPEDVVVRVPPTGEPRSVQILAIENRLFVLNGDKGENFAGIVRKVFGIPVDRETPDKSPLASSLGERLRIGFVRAGYDARFRPSPKGSTVADELRNASSTRTDIVFVLNIRDWRYDHGGIEPTFFYDLGVSIFDGTHRLLGTTDVRGTKPGAVGGYRLSEERYAMVYRSVLDSIFSDPTIAEALVSQPQSEPQAR